MKNKKLEHLRKMQRNYHRHHSWQRTDGHYVPLATEHPLPVNQATSGPQCSASFGFVFGGRRVHVWWDHPKMVYGSAVAKLAREKIGNPASPMRWLLDTLASRERGGRRKRGRLLFGDNHHSIMPNWLEQYQLVVTEIGKAGIPLEVIPSVKIRKNLRSTMVSLVAPLRMREEPDFFQLAQLTARLLCGQTTLRDEFPEYSYGASEWRMEHSDHQ